MVLVILIDEVQQDGTALKEPDGLVAKLVRDGWNLRAALAGFPPACNHNGSATHPPIWVDLQEPVLLSTCQSLSGRVPCNPVAPHLLCVLGQIYGCGLFDSSTQCHAWRRASATLTL